MQKKVQKVYTPKGDEETQPTGNGTTTNSNNSNNNRNNQRNNNTKSTTIPQKYKITPAVDPEFNLEKCMENFRLGDQPYNKESDYYFDSYSHFHIHEEMLKDRVS